ncbi:MAG TPA: flagellar motor switch protein FliM [Clostridiales bacterium]|nr:MAG: flagellar motor switch protein FliM [Clostridiales bacterium GWD2_32_59]HAN10600.1 flagellar motor switch protein FliM [Clostridiales bacterium]
MSDVLSQNEIDDLLNALNSGDFDISQTTTGKGEKKIKKYDFARPSKFSKEHLKTLEIIYENYSRSVASYFSSYLRTPTHVEVINSEALTYREFTNSLSNPIILGIIDFKPLKGSILMKISSKVGFTILDRVLGGPGTVLKTNRDFTQIEKILLTKIMDKLVKMMGEHWTNIHIVQPKLEQLETNMQFAEMIEPNEMVALMTLNIKVGDVEGMINICIPYLVIEPLMEFLNTKYWYTNHKNVQVEDYKNYMEGKIQISQIPIRTILGKTQIMVKDFLELQLGDVIRLDSYVSSDLNVYVGDLLKFKGKPGISKKKNALKITKIVREEEE